MSINHEIRIRALEARCEVLEAWIAEFEATVEAGLAPGAAPEPETVTKPGFEAVQKRSGAWQVVGLNGHIRAADNGQGLTEDEARNLAQELNAP